MADRKKDLLSEFGLSANESKIYLALLHIGGADSAELARESGVHRINVYDVLNSLISKGLVSYITEGGRRIFKPENPTKLREMLQEKQNLLDKELPLLLEQYSSRKQSWDVSILRGTEGKRSQFEELLRIALDTENRVYIPHGLISLVRPPYNTMLRVWFEKLAKKNVSSKLLILDSPEARERAKIFEGLKKHDLRFSKKISFSPFSYDVCCDLLYLTLHIEPYLIIRIKSKEVADAFINSFDMMWKASES
jgi:sugar-specific transcriptional regulator TrmB